jgi:hypothetical protein
MYSKEKTYAHELGKYSWLLLKLSILLLLIDTHRCGISPVRLLKRTESFNGLSNRMVVDARLSEPVEPCRTLKCEPGGKSYWSGAISQLFKNCVLLLAISGFKVHVLL